MTCQAVVLRRSGCDGSGVASVPLVMIGDSVSAVYCVLTSSNGSYMVGIRGRWRVIARIWKIGIEDLEVVRML